MTGLKWYDHHADNPPWIKALAEVRLGATREGYCYQHVQAIIVAIDQYAEKALGNREFFLNKPHSIGGGRSDDIPLERGSTKRRFAYITIGLDAVRRHFTVQPILLIGERQPSGFHPFIPYPCSPMFCLLGKHRAIFGILAILIRLFHLIFLLREKARQTSKDHQLNSRGKIDGGGFS